MVVELHHKFNWLRRSHIIGTFQKPWSEWVAMVDVGQERDVCFSLDGSVLDHTRSREASLSISILLTNHSDPTAGRRELDAAKGVATKLESADCASAAIKYLKSIVEKIDSIREILDDTSQVYFVSLSVIH